MVARWSIGRDVLDGGWIAATELEATVFDVPRNPAALGEVGRYPVEVVGAVLRPPPAPVKKHHRAATALTRRQEELGELRGIGAIAVAYRADSGDRWAPWCG
jgi:hypothetical protein